MYKHILLPTDGSELADRGIEHGLALAKAFGARVTFLTVSEMWSPVVMATRASAGDLDPIAHYETEMAAAAEGLLDEARGKARAAGVEAEALHISDRHPAETIVEIAAERGCDLIVMASHGHRGARRMMLGSQTNEVVTHTTIPVLVIR